MKKIQIIWLTLFAVFALGAFAVSPALASGELLLNGLKLTATQEIPIQISGELLLADTGASTEPAIVCSGIFDAHSVGGSLMFVAEILTLAGVSEGNLVLCKKQKTCEGEAIDVTALNLPWHIEIELMLVGGVSIYLVIYLNEEGKVPSYDIDCVVPLLGLEEDTCSGGSTGRLNNTSEGLLGYLNKLALTEEFGAESENFNCTVGGTGKGLVESEPSTKAGGGLITSTSGTLTVSE